MGPVGSIRGSVEESLIVSARARIVSGKSGSVPPNCIHFVVVLWNRLLSPRPQLRCSGFPSYYLYFLCIQQSPTPLLTYPHLLCFDFSDYQHFLAGVRVCDAKLALLFFFCFLLGWYLGDYSCFSSHFIFPIF